MVVHSTLHRVGKAPHSGRAAPCRVQRSCLTSWTCAGGGAGRSASSLASQLNLAQPHFTWCNLAQPRATSAHTPAAPTAFKGSAQHGAAPHSYTAGELGPTRKPLRFHSTPSGAPAVLREAADTTQHPRRHRCVVGPVGRVGLCRHLVRRAPSGSRASLGNADTVFWHQHRRQVKRGVVHVMRPKLHWGSALAHICAFLTVLQWLHLYARYSSGWSALAGPRKGILCLQECGY